VLFEGISSRALREFEQFFAGNPSYRPFTVGASEVAMNANVRVGGTLTAANVSSSPIQTGAK
jgi:hypothetical protein